MAKIVRTRGTHTHTWYAYAHVVRIRTRGTRVRSLNVTYTPVGGVKGAGKPKADRATTKKEKT